MDSISPGIFSDVCKFIKTYQGRKLSFNLNQKIIGFNTKCKYIFDFLEKLDLYKNNTWKINQEISEKDFDEDYKQFVLSKYMKTLPDHLRKNIKWSISTFIDYLEDNEKACLKLANLEPKKNSFFLNEKAVKWYKDLIPKSNEKDKSLIGNKGEFLTINFEINRLNVNREDLYCAFIDDSSRGYDVKSYLKKDKKTEQYIEVKTISNSAKKEIFITRNEINKSKILPNYLYYVWDISSQKNKLYIFNSSEFDNDCPVEIGYGKIDLYRIEMNDKLKNKAFIFFP